MPNVTIPELPNKDDLRAQKLMAIASATHTIGCIRATLFSTPDSRSINKWSAFSAKMAAALVKIPHLSRLLFEIATAIDKTLCPATLDQAMKEGRHLQDLASRLKLSVHFLSGCSPQNTPGTGKRGEAAPDREAVTAIKRQHSRGALPKYDPLKDKKLVEDWRASGLPQKQFERNKGLDPKTIKKALDRLRKQPP